MTENKVTAVVTPKQMEKQTAKANYFGHRNNQKRRKVIVETPLGEEKEFEEAHIIDDPNALKYGSGEYLAVEVTPNCNVGCSTCFNGSNRRQVGSEGIRYMSSSFAEQLAEAIGDNPYTGRVREICTTGGEPTLDLDRLVEITSIFAGLGGSNRIVVPTNSTVLPLDENELEDALARFDDNVVWQMSYNIPLLRQYERFRGDKNPYYQIPDSKDPLLEKILKIKRAAQKLDIRTTVRVGGLTHELDDVYDYVTKHTGKKEKLFSVYAAHIRNIGSAEKTKGAAERDTKVDKNHEKMYITSNGTIYPSMHLWGSDLELGTVCRIKRFSA